MCWNHVFYRVAILHRSRFDVWKFLEGSRVYCALSYINVSRKVGGRRVSGWRPAKLNLKVRVYPYTRQSSPRSCREVANHHLATFTTLDSPRLQSFQARLYYRNTRCFSSRVFHLFSLSLSLSTGILQCLSRKRSLAVLAGSLPT